jgi:cytochrome oxidase assembly protein ShyY1
VLVNRGWVPPNWKAEWQQHFMAQQPQGLVTVSGVVQGSESPSSYVPENKPEEGLFFWVDVPGLVSSSSSSTHVHCLLRLLRELSCCQLGASIVTRIQYQ